MIPSWAIVTGLSLALACCKVQSLVETSSCSKLNFSQMTESDWLSCRINEPYNRFIYGQKEYFRRFIKPTPQMRHLPELYQIVEHLNTSAEICEVMVTIGQIWIKQRQWNQVIQEISPCLDRIALLPQSLQDQVLLMAIQAFKQSGREDELIQLVNHQWQLGLVTQWNVQTLVWIVGVLESLKAFDLALKVLDMGHERLAQVGIDGSSWQQRLMIQRQRLKNRSNR